MADFGKMALSQVGVLSTRDITVNITLNVPSSYATINAALNYLKDKRLLNGAVATISVASGTYNEGVINFNHPNGEQIKIVGATPTGTKPDITNQTTYPTSTDRLNALKAYFPTVINFTGTAGFVVGSSTIGLLDNLLLVGNFAGNNSHGICINQYGTGTSNGCINIGEVGIHGFNNYGISVKNGGTINAKTAGLTLSDNRDGFGISKGGTINADQAVITNCVGGGIYIEYNGTVSIKSGKIIKSGGRGVYILYGGVVNGDGAKVSYSTGINVYILYGGTVNLNAGESSYSGSHGLQTNYGGSINAMGAKVTNNTAAGLTIDYGGDVILQNADILNNGDAGVAIAQNGSVNIKDAVIDGSGFYAVHGIYGGNFEMTRTCITANNGVNYPADPVRVKLKGNAFATSEGAGSTIGRSYTHPTSGVTSQGKSGLVAASFSPAYGTLGNGSSYIGNPS